VEKGDVETEDYLIQVKYTEDDKIRVYYEDIIEEIKEAEKINKRWKRIIFLRDKMMEMEETKDDYEEETNNLSIIINKEEK